MALTWTCGRDRNSGQHVSSWRPDFKPLVVCDASERGVAERALNPAITWQSFLLDGVAGIGRS